MRENKTDLGKNVVELDLFDPYGQCEGEGGPVWDMFVHDIAPDQNHTCCVRPLFRRND